MPTIGQLFGSWAAEQATIEGRSTTLGQPEVLGPPATGRSAPTRYAHTSFQVARRLQDTYALQYSLQATQAALNQAEPTSLEAGELRRIKNELLQALRARGASLEPAQGFAPADQLRLYQAFGLRNRRVRPDEDDGDADGASGIDGGE